MLSSQSRTAIGVQNGSELPGTMAVTMTADTRTESPFATVEEAIEEIRAGRFVVVVDDEDRENEGDLTIAAQFATPEAVNFMVTHARGSSASA